ncbi:hypothetical protein PAHAL_4G056200 [Panicum hallii]|uniref:Uncharacterized protein n=1 Tax=Panicum hallii TaxID=206008 RepID=A0A2T8JBW2_9POAL|nr:hypothetical protein PAHAL_4G056200 [Panicum hallii]
MGFQAGPWQTPQPINPFFFPSTHRISSRRLQLMPVTRVTSPPRRPPLPSLNSILPSATPAPPACTLPWWCLAPATDLPYRSSSTRLAVRHHLGPVVLDLQLPLGISLLAMDPFPRNRKPKTPNP